MQEIINILKFIIIGIVQGITEILPLSSSGHLAIVYKILNIDVKNQLDLTIYLHVASSISLLLYFKKDLLILVKEFFSYLFKKKKESFCSFKMVIYLIIASIPAGICGIFISSFIEETFNNVNIIAINFTITAIVLIIKKNISFKKQLDYNFKNTFIIGVFQSFAIFPGISRSGITLFGGKISKLNDEYAKKFSFYLLIIISFGSSFLSLLKNKIIINNETALYIISMLVASLFTYLSLKLFFSKKTNKSKFFPIYLLIISFLILLFM